MDDDFFNMHKTKVYLNVVIYSFTINYNVS